MIKYNPSLYSDGTWLSENSFDALVEISRIIDSEENIARECIIRLLEHRDVLASYNQIINDLIQRVGLYPYLSNDKTCFSTADLINVERHIPIGLDEIVLHSMQGKVYRALMDGANVILSAPTSFGKSLLIDAMIASEKYANIVVIVPTIALIDETRRRLSRKFNPHFKIITHVSQERCDKNIFIFTQERFIEFPDDIRPDFFVIDEFYKLSPERKDDRTFVLNHAFYKLVKSGAQFFLIGPNVHNISIGSEHLSFRYIDTNFSTVVADVRHITNEDIDRETLKICSSLDSSTLIFCKSARSAYSLGQYLIENDINASNQETQRFAEWLVNNYHPDWDLIKLLQHGIAIHHGALPRSISYHILRLFNEGKIRFLLCTSTIIEGVNTVAENIIIYDNKIATSKFDLFTFNNIKGRAGRMFKHFVGHVFVLNYEMQRELPFVDIPVLTQPESAPESLLIHIDSNELSEHSLEKLRYLHAQDYLPIEIIRQNSDISPEMQVEVAKSISDDISTFHGLLGWRRYPTKEQRLAFCELIFDKFMEGRPKDDIVLSAKQMSFLLGRYTSIKALDKLIMAEIANNKGRSATEAIESVFAFLRRWAEHHFPRYILALNKIQSYVFGRYGKIPGDYEHYVSEIRKWFMPLSATTLEEYGIPLQVTLKIEQQIHLGESVDEILNNITKMTFNTTNLTQLERELLEEARNNL